MQGCNHGTLSDLPNWRIRGGSICGDKARLDIRARGFWKAGQSAFFDVRVFNLIAKRHVNQTLSKCYEQNEKEKKRHYNDRVQQVEHGSFTPLVFSATGGMGRECWCFVRRLCEMLSEKRKLSYNDVATWL